jgi:DinB superfamily
MVAGLVADDKDWTWVLERRCPECGFDAAAMPLDQASALLTDAAAQLQVALSRPDARKRPTPTTWSALEYSCHVRETFAVFRNRIALVIEQDDPTFANWDQDATAVEQRYDLQDPDIVGSELQAALDTLVRELETIPDDAWDRPALRSNGSRFTLATLVRYLVHDPVHHVHDVQSASK